MATQVSTFVLQCCGLPAFSFGNTIVIEDFHIGVVDACNGLGMCYMFLALSVAAAFVVHRPRLDKLLLVASAIPIALISNVFRITACGLLNEMIGSRVAVAVYHDLAGWLMLVLTLAVLFLECRFFSALFIEIEDTRGIRIEPREEHATGGAQLVSREKSWRAIPLLVGMAFVIASGIVDGLQTNRWRTSQQLRLAVSRLDRVPLAIGDWRGRAEPIDPRETTAAELDGCLLQRYENLRTGRAITLVLVCGRPGPVSLHSPEICYPGAGLEMAQGAPAKVAVPGGRRGKQAEFLRADFEQERSFPHECLRIAWSWKGTGPWSVPTQPRITFASQPFLYKLYLVYRPGWDTEQAEDDSFSDFLQRLLPELDQALDPGSGASAERPRPHEADFTGSST
jgi:exosortase/archaeosortase family protein